MVGPEFLREMEEQMLKIKKNLKLLKIGRKAMLTKEALTGS